MPVPTIISRPITNFGGNVRYRADTYYEPANEQDVLEILSRHKGAQIRVVGSLHSWSDAIRGDAVVISLRNLNGVEFHENEEGAIVDLAAGCQIKRALRELRRHGDWTLPAIGLITEQTVAGAISTGTHGSGNHSLSHHVQQVRVAIHDADSGEPRIVTIDAGPDLRAARCGLGCLGIILTVRFRCRREYHVSELNKRHDCIDDILAREQEAPLQHFFLIPHDWKFIAQHRRIVEPIRGPIRRLVSWFYFANWFLMMDVGLHLIMSFLARLLRSRFLIRRFFRHVVPHTVPQDRVFVGRSDQVLTWENALFRHIEMEFFVQREHLGAALRLLTEILRVLDGQADEPPQAVADQLRRVELLDRLRALRGSYTHHYPICIRRILPDDTMISMASGDEDWYSISLISLQRPHDVFQAMADFVATATTRLFGARLHWGKFFPLDGEHARATYPELGDFAEICRKYDPTGVFQNEFTRNVLSEVRSEESVSVRQAFSS